MAITIEPFKGDETEFTSGRVGRSESPETIELRKALHQSAKSKRPLKITPEGITLDTLKSRLYQIGQKEGIIPGARTHVNGESVVIHATYRPGMEPVTVAEPATEETKRPPLRAGRRRTSAKS